ATAIPMISQNHNVIIQSYTGSGKTPAFTYFPYFAKRGAGDRHDPLLVLAENILPLDSIPAYHQELAQHKIDTLRKCVHTLDAKSVIVFMNHSKRLKDVVFKLEARRIKDSELHGDIGKLARSTILKKFKGGEVRVLVTNELSARGLDVG
ncbi:hypothetical protein IFM89_028603, partial [Coptis chinensis]